MSKVDAMQAMREARYAARAGNKTATVPKPVAAAPRRQAAGGVAAVPSTSSVASPAAASSASAASSARADGPASESVGVPSAAVEVEPEAEEALCGHRSMNNRLCRRPAGHSEKNHRYN